MSVLDTITLAALGTLAHKILEDRGLKSPGSSVSAAPVTGLSLVLPTDDAGYRSKMNSLLGHASSEDQTLVSRMATLAFVMNDLHDELPKLPSNDPVSHISVGKGGRNDHLYSISYLGGNVVRELRSSSLKLSKNICYPSVSGDYVSLDRAGTLSDFIDNLGIEIHFWRSGFGVEIPDATPDHTNLRGSPCWKSSIITVTFPDNRNVHYLIYVDGMYPLGIYAFYSNHSDGFEASGITVRSCSSGSHFYERHRVPKSPGSSISVKIAAWLEPYCSGGGALYSLMFIAIVWPTIAWILGFELKFAPDLLVNLIAGLRTANALQFAGYVVGISIISVATLFWMGWLPSEGPSFKEYLRQEKWWSLPNTTPEGIADGILVADLTLLVVLGCIIAGGAVLNLIFLVPILAFRKNWLWHGFGWPSKNTGEALRWHLEGAKRHGFDLKNLH